MSTEEQRLAQLLKRTSARTARPAVRRRDHRTFAGRRPGRGRRPRWQRRRWWRSALPSDCRHPYVERPHRAPSPLAGSGTAASKAPQTSATCAGRTVTVPNVVGEAMNAAGAVLQSTGLQEGIYFAASARVPPGTVLAQSPTACCCAVPGAEVQLEIASTPSTSAAASADPGMEVTGTPTPLSPCHVVGATPPAANATISIPNVVGTMSNQARWELQAAGFDAAMVITAAPASRPVPPGTVWAQSPAPGSSARRWSGVTLYVAPAS